MKVNQPAPLVLTIILSLSKEKNLNSCIRIFSHETLFVSAKTLLSARMNLFSSWP